MTGIKREEIQDAKVKELWWQKRGLMFTSTGYGDAIPTRYMVKVTNRWYRVYCCIHSNSGTLYIKKFPKGEGRFGLNNVVDDNDIMDVIAENSI
ncbi:MAG: hypothetical protein M0P69_11430 [Bacteroidales bacterium]|nr:hypothetical protein [Bacteroidales bacterium]